MVFNDREKFIQSLTVLMISDDAKQMPIEERQKVLNYIRKTECKTISDSDWSSIAGDVNLTKTMVLNALQDYKEHEDDPFVPEIVTENQKDTVEEPISSSKVPEEPEPEFDDEGDGEFEMNDEFGGQTPEPDDGEPLKEKKKFSLGGLKPKFDKDSLKKFALGGKKKNA